MRESGLLGPDIDGYRPVPLAVGDVVVCRQNNPRLGTTNGARGRITSITPRELTLATSDQRSSFSRTPTRARAHSSTPTRSPATSPKQRRSTPPWS